MDSGHLGKGVAATSQAKRLKLRNGFGRIGSELSRIMTER